MDLPTSRVSVFLGPTLGRDAAMQVLRARYLPPARRGDFYRLLATGVDTILLIDGVFHGEPSVLHREICDVMGEGIRVYGCSSMGALRAAELAPMGMLGHGHVFELYRDGVIDGDDEVALLHAPEEDRFRPLSEPLINLRVSLWALANDDLIPRALADALIEEAKATFYPERSWRRLTRSALLESCAESLATVVRRIAADGGMDVKRRDAFGLLRHVAASDSFQAADRPAEAMEPLVEYPERALLRRVRHGCRESELGELLPRVHAAGWVAKLRRPLVIRWFVADWARCRGVELRVPKPGADLASTPSEPNAPWLIERGLTAREFRLWRDEARLAEEVLEAGSERFGLTSTERNEPWHPFLMDWCRIRGVGTLGTASGSAVSTQELFAESLIREGPERFGFVFDLQLRVLRELQCTVGLGVLPS